MKKNKENGLGFVLCLNVARKINYFGLIGTKQQDR